MSTALNDASKIRLKNDENQQNKHWKSIVMT